VASLSIRPLLVGTGAQVGVHPASDNLSVVLVTPAGPYFKGGFSTNPYVIIREFDRAAPLGTGTYKVGWPTMLPACVPIGTRTIWVMPASSISMPYKSNTWTTVVLPTSSASRNLRLLVRNPLPSCPPSATLACICLAEVKGFQGLKGRPGSLEKEVAELLNGNRFLAGYGLAVFSPPHRNVIWPNYKETERSITVFFPPEKG
jgi:Branched-chain amino acid aminotransferase/4-amino-4-deoxychorismate lyase